MTRHHRWELARTSERQAAALAFLAQSVSFAWSEKVLTTAGAVRAWLQVARHGAGAPVAMTCGNFDPVHFGHVDGFYQGVHELAVRRGVAPDQVALLVAVDCDETVAEQKGAGRPAWPLWAKCGFLAALAVVSAVVPFQGGNPGGIIHLVRPDLYFKGGDRLWHGMPAGERAALNRLHVPFYRTERRLPLASSQLAGSQGRDRPVQGQAGTTVKDDA